MPAVQPSTERPTSWVAPACTPAMSRRRAGEPRSISRCPRGCRRSRCSRRRSSRTARTAASPAARPTSASSRGRPCRGSELPRGAVDDRREERGVDLVEAVVRHDDGREAGDLRRKVRASRKGGNNLGWGEISWASAGATLERAPNIRPTIPPASAATPIAEPVRSRFRRLQSGMPARGSAVSVRRAVCISQLMTWIPAMTPIGTQRADCGRCEWQPQDRQEADDPEGDEIHRRRSRTGPGRDSRAVPRTRARCR